MNNEPNSVRQFRAAVYEVKSNLEVRRLMLIIMHILVPTMAVAVTGSLIASDYPPQLAWLPRFVPALAGGSLAIAGVLVTGVLARCHRGLVVNSCKMGRVTTGTVSCDPLNWLGVTTNFTALTALSSGVGAALFLSFITPSIWAIVAGAALSVALMAVLQVNHWLANRLTSKLACTWEQGEVPPSLREQHARVSLDATTADIAVVVTMAAALFAGTFNGMATLSGASEQLPHDQPWEMLRIHGVVILSAYTLALLFLSGRMVLRLRIAIAQHSATLAQLRHESDDPYRFRPFERTYLLFLLVHAMTCTSALILVWSVGGRTSGVVTGTVLFIIGAVWYPAQLEARRYRHHLASDNSTQPAVEQQVMLPPVANNDD